MTVAKTLPKTLAQSIGRMEGWKYTPLHGIDLPERANTTDIRFDNPGDQYMWERVAHTQQIIVRKGETRVVIDRMGDDLLSGCRVSVEEGGNLFHLRDYRDVGADCFALVHAQVAGGGLYTHIALTRGAKTLRLPVQIELQSPQARCDIRGVHDVADTAHVDQVVLIKHNAPHCHSNQNFRYIVSSEAQAAFQGKILVARDAQKTEAYQLCKSLLLNEGAQVNTKPELEIYADDVKCSHGATSGELDEKALFYMQSRGVPRAEAKTLLIRAFIAEVFDGLDAPEEAASLIGELTDE